MVKEVELALAKRQLNEAKELIAELQADNTKLRDKIVKLEAVEVSHGSKDRSNSLLSNAQTSSKMPWTSPSIERKKKQLGSNAKSSTTS